MSGRVLLSMFCCAKTWTAAVEVTEAGANVCFRPIADTGGLSCQWSVGTAELSARLAAMVKYRIELRTENTIWEALEVERESLTELRVELARFVGELLKEHAEQIWVDETWRVDVTDGTGLILYVMYISASETAATARTPVSGS